jgi:uroporphyrinogen III methyltransferase/synthase
MPLVAHEANPDPEPLNTALTRLGEFDWAVFTSARAVDEVCAHRLWACWPWDAASKPRVGAVGPITKACLTKHGIPVAVHPAVPGAHGLALALIGVEGGGLAGRTVFWPRSNLARPDLREALVAAGARVVDPVVYLTTAVRPPDLPEFLRDLGAGRVDAVTFLSPSSAENLAALMDGGTLSVLAGRTSVASVGPTTTAALTKLGAPPTVEARDRTGSGLAAVLLSYVGLRPPLLRSRARFKGDLP